MCRTRLPKITCEQAASPPMPWPTPRNTPNCSSAGSHTFTQLCRKLPIGYNGAPTIAPKLPLPMDQSHTQLPASSLDPSNLPSQTASISQSAVLPQCTGQTEQTNRWLEETFYDYRSLSLYRECCSIIIMQNICHFTVTPYTMSH